MTHASMESAVIEENKTWLVWIFAGLVIATAVFWAMRDGQLPSYTSTSASSSDVEVNSVDDLKKLDKDTVTAMQREAESAAAQAVGFPPLAGPVTERPAYVSVVEWQILKAVAEQQPNSEQALTNLVNKLRFSKQWELWQVAQPGAKSDALAQQLLNDIPLQVENRDLAVGDAQMLQTQLLEQLVSNPEQRRLRAAEEAARINVKFEIE